MVTIWGDARQMRKMAGGICCASRIESGAWGKIKTTPRYTTSVGGQSAVPAPTGAAFALTMRQVYQIAWFCDSLLRMLFC